MRALIAVDGSAGAAEAVALAQTIAWPADRRLTNRQRRRTRRMDSAITAWSR